MLHRRGGGPRQAGDGAHGQHPRCGGGQPGARRHRRQAGRGRRHRGRPGKRRRHHRCRQRRRAGHRRQGRAAGATADSRRLPLPRRRRGHRHGRRRVPSPGAARAAQPCVHRCHRGSHLPGRHHHHRLAGRLRKAQRPHRLLAHRAAQAELGQRRRLRRQPVDNLAAGGVTHGRGGAAGAGAVHRHLALRRRARDPRHRRGRRACGDHLPQLGLRLGPVRRGLHAVEHAAHHGGRAHRLLGRAAHPGHVRRHEP
mmetsp:Transcript_14636/g.34543  ORF Transcript_14636/g.34543 Transcript_14636/m.34543 type:complete len:254 (+) Transcript_14636:1895-2656(+)